MFYPGFHESDDDSLLGVKMNPYFSRRTTIDDGGRSFRGEEDVDHLQGDDYHAHAATTTKKNASTFSDLLSLRTKNALESKALDRQLSWTGNSMKYATFFSGLVLEEMESYTQKHPFGLDADSANDFPGIEFFAQTVGRRLQKEMVNTVVVCMEKAVCMENGASAMENGASATNKTNEDNRSAKRLKTNDEKFTSTSSSSSSSSSNVHPTAVVPLRGNTNKNNCINKTKNDSCNKNNKNKSNSKNTNIEARELIEDGELVVSMMSVHFPDELKRLVASFLGPVKPVLFPCHAVVSYARKYQREAIFRRVVPNILAEIQKRVDVGGTCRFSDMHIRWHEFCRGISGAKEEGFKEGVLRRIRALGYTVEQSRHDGTFFCVKFEEDRI